MKRKIRLLSLLLLLFFGVASVLYFALSEKQGSVGSLVQLPGFGGSFPDGIHVDEVKYSYFPGTKHLLATAKISRSEFMRMCKELKIDPLPYPQGFQDGVVTDARYAPTNGAVYLGEKSLHSEGRTGLRVYFQPSGDLSGATGRLFVQVVH